MIPLNNHIQIEPEKHEDFIASANTTYEEIGKVVALPAQISIEGRRYFSTDLSVKVGDRVYFDSWMAAKYPAGEGKFYWLVPFENIKAYEPISKESVQGGVPPQLSDNIDPSARTGGTMQEMRIENLLPSTNSEPQIHGVSYTAGSPAIGPDVSERVSTSA